MMHERWSAEGDGPLICRASWLMDRDEAEPWPLGQWQPCHNDATNMAHLTIAPNVAIFIPLCGAHEELWADAIGKRPVSLDIDSEQRS